MLELVRIHLKAEHETLNSHSIIIRDECISKQPHNITFFGIEG